MTVVRGRRFHGSGDGHVAVKALPHHGLDLERLGLPGSKGHVQPVQGPRTVVERPCVQSVGLGRVVGEQRGVHWEVDIDGQASGRG